MIQFVSIELRPHPVVMDEAGTRQLDIRVRADGIDYHVREFLPANHFDSLFDRLMERAAQKIKRMVREQREKEKDGGK